MTIVLAPPWKLSTKRESPSFFKVSSHALQKNGIEHRFVHLDSTTFSLHGAYEREEGAEENPEVVSITKGYSKDNATKLNQGVLSKMTTY